MFVQRGTHSIWLCAVIASLSVFSCSDDDADGPRGDGGEGGSLGGESTAGGAGESAAAGGVSAGASGSSEGGAFPGHPGGSSNDAGTAGAHSSGGDAPGGQSTGGAAGSRATSSSGAGGEMVSGETSGAAGVAGSPEGGGESLGGSGGGGAASGPDVATCAEACDEDEDCLAPYDSGNVCENNRCVPRCAGDVECTDRSVIDAGNNACTTDQDCATGGPPNRLCVTLSDGHGYCASTGFLPSGNGCPAEKLPRPKADGTGLVEVCVVGAVCTSQGTCERPCVETCATGKPQRCLESGECACATNEHCTGVPNQPVCETATGRCVCTAEEHCDEGFACVGGACAPSCEDASECGPPTRSATVAVCEVRR